MEVKVWQEHRAVKEIHHRAIFHCFVTILPFPITPSPLFEPFSNVRKWNDVIKFQKPSLGYEKYLRSLKMENLIDPSVNISMFYKWKEGRQEDRNPFFEWLQTILGITTTTPSPPLTPPDNCGECSCGKINNNRIVGGTETGINQYPWMVWKFYFTPPTMLLMLLCSA